MLPFNVASCFLLIVTVAATKIEHDTDRFPRLFHLDNYERCLSKRNGLYCLGTFQLSSDSPNSMFDSLKEYSSNSIHFNHTLLHRGYCVSSRCQSSERNATLRFERCVQDRTQLLSMNATLKTLKYCRKSKQAKTFEDNEQPYIIVGAVVVVLLVLNAIGTVYHAVVGNKKNSILNSWSVKENWRRLVRTYDDSDSIRAALSPIQGARVLLLFFVVIGHAIEITHKVHLANPIFLETAQKNPMSIFFKNGSSIVQVFVVVSNFLFAYMLLAYSQKNKVSISMLPLSILYRIVRISPVYLLMVGFKSSWWRLAGDGPLWSDLVIPESDVCRKKFWLHAFYLQNLIEPEKWCMLQSWFLAVDMQLHFVTCFLTLVLLNNRRRALYIIGALFIASCVVNSGLAYIYDWKPLMYLLSPEVMRNTFEGVSSFWYFYTTPWGSLPACLLGLFVAHLHFYAKEQGYQIKNTKVRIKWLVQLYHIAVPICLAWVLSGYIISSWTTRRSTATYIAIERPMFSALSALLLYGSTDKLDNCYRRFMAWSGWQVPARLSLCVLVLHRTINITLVAIRTAAVTTSVFAIATDVIITMFASYLLAIPLMVLVEMPIQRTFVTYITRGKQYE
ncbi:O-acyltransferase like protein [Papilio machaon]|uniref:O-acyltransferase like protein n=1 Tax=Papilio machaon TaxID=76193 RepID=UPI001E665A66|nr:O-acyltransferase like protein [Papilio machaon]